MGPSLLRWCGPHALEKDYVGSSMAQKMLRIVTYEDVSDPYFNLAIEEAIFIAACRGIIKCSTLRLWRNENAVVLGYFSDIGKEVNQVVLRKIRASVARRFTGGGSVYHDLGNLNYSVVTQRSRGTGPIDFIYGYLLKGLTTALRKLGLRPHIENVSDVVVGDRKVSGNAGSFRGDHVILHGTVLVWTNPEIIEKLFKIPWDKVRKYGISLSKYRVTNLRKLLHREVSMREVSEAIVRSYAELLNVCPVNGKLSSEELEIANILYEMKYSRSEWNKLRRYPAKQVNELIDRVLRK